MEWIEVGIETSTEGIEILCGVIYNTEVLGVYIEDKNDLGNNDKENWDYLDENLLPLKDGAILRAYYEQSDKFLSYYNMLKDALEGLEKYDIPKGKGSITFSNVCGEDWENNWKQYFKPVKVTDKLVVKPLWEDFTSQNGQIILNIDPGMAFGTGTHETTGMCLAMIEKYLVKDMRVFDIGTGSGILAIAASLFGAKEVIGVDLDPVAVDSAKRNVSYNGLNNVEILHGNFLEATEGKAHMVIANIIADSVIFLSPLVKDVLIKGGMFITSGILSEHANRVKKELFKEGYKLMEEKQMGEWVALVCSL